VTADKPLRLGEKHPILENCYRGNYPNLITSVNNQSSQSNDLLLSQYHYNLPPEYIAQTPAVPRDTSRLLVVNSRTNQVHSTFHNLTEWLLPGDLLVLNNTRVIPARLYGQKVGGALVEVLLLEEVKHNCWLALVRPGKRFKLGTEIIFPNSNNPSEYLKVIILERDEATGGRILQFEIPEGQTFWSMLERIGEMPLPPYITSRAFCDEQYQTIYATKKGAIAAPTAGLHFTEELLTKLKDRGVEIVYITLHVGLGTFRPVETETITNHNLHHEWIEVNADTIEKINATKTRGGRVIAVGTTSVRALEGTADASQLSKGKKLKAFCGKTNLFIYPGYRWQIVDGLITNFHLPGSSLLMLVSALIGRKRLLELYQEAISNNYRFYSFGDAMLILPSARIDQYSIVDIVDNE
jgi:S-adenosylmethionine:tRNA ribosyltransferase-isomerase